MRTPTPTFARAQSSNVWHLLQKGLSIPRTYCDRDASVMARFDAGDLPSGERNGRICETCRAA